MDIRTHYNHSTRTTKQWYECHHQQTSLPGDQHSPNEESDTKVLSIGKVSIIQTTNLHNPPPNPEGSITKEVNHLLDQAMAELPSCKS